MTHALANTKQHMCAPTSAPPPLGHLRAQHAPAQPRARYSISHTNITDVLQTYFNLQEEGGETDEPLHQGEALQSQGHAHDPESLTAYLFPSGLPRKLAQYTPDYFLVVDSGATVHVLWVSICTAYTKESNSAIKWGGIDSRERVCCLLVLNLVSSTHSQCMYIYRTPKCGDVL